MQNSKRVRKSTAGKSRLVSNIAVARRMLAVVGYDAKQLPNDTQCIAMQLVVIKYFTDRSRGGDDLRVDGCVPWNPGPGTKIFYICIMYVLVSYVVQYIKTLLFVSFACIY